MRAKRYGSAHRLVLLLTVVLLAMTPPAVPALAEGEASGAEQTSVDQILTAEDYIQLAASFLYRPSTGENPNFNANQAVVFYEKAAGMGSTRAMLLLGDLYRDGAVQYKMKSGRLQADSSKSVSSSYSKAVEWYTRGAEAGDATCQERLNALQNKAAAAGIGSSAANAGTGSTTVKTGTGSTTVKTSSGSLGAAFFPWVFLGLMWVLYFVAKSNDEKHKANKATGRDTNSRGQAPSAASPAVSAAKPSAPATAAGPAAPAPADGERKVTVINGPGPYPQADIIGETFRR